MNDLKSRIGLTSLPDLTAPEVAETIPGPDRLASRLTPIVLTFSELIDGAALSTRTSNSCNGTVQVSLVGSNECVAMTAEQPALSTTPDGKRTVAIFTPQAALAAGADYQILIAATARQGITDLAGNVLPSYAVNFTTRSLGAAAGTGTPAYTDISAGEGANSGITPRIAINGNNLYIVAQNNARGGVPGLTHCNLLGDHCQYQDISVGEGGNSGQTPQIAVDSVNERLLIVTNNGARGNRLSLFRCNLLGADCNHMDISAGQGENSATNPSVAVDTAGERLLIVTENSASNSTPSLYICGLDGSSCSHQSLSADTNSGRRPRILLDTISPITSEHRLLILTYGDLGTTMLFRCQFDGTACTNSDITPTDSGYLPAPAIDSQNARLLLATENASSGQRLSIFMREPDGTPITHLNVSSNSTPVQGGASGWRPSLAVDVADNALLAAAQHGGNGSRPVLYRCTLPDIANCTSSDWSAGVGANSGRFPQLHVDAIHRRLIMVTENGSNGHRLALFAD